MKKSVLALSVCLCTSLLYGTISYAASSDVKSLDMSAFKAATTAKNTVIVDTRDDSVYNGFKEKGADRGGHVPKAVQFTTEWLDKIQADKFESFAVDKGLTKDKTLVFYDIDPVRTERVAAAFASHGYKVNVFNQFVDYTKDKSNRLESFPKYQLLVSPTWVKDVLDGKRAETYKGGPVKVFHVAWGDIAQADGYKVHVPGAFHFNTDWIENGPIWNLSDPSVILANLLKQGITKDTTVILYAEHPMPAFRVLWALYWAGVEDIRIMNGGMEAWCRHKYPIETKVNTPQPVSTFGTTIPSHPEVDIATAREAYEAQKHGTKLVSIRSWDEYVGNVSGYDYIPRAGEPAGAIWGFGGTDPNNSAAFYDPDGTLRNPYEIFNLWKGQGLHKGDSLAFYCGTGWGAAIPWLITKMAGWPNTKVFDGGWNDWQMDMTLPVLHVAPGTKRPDMKNDYGATQSSGTSCKF